MRKLIKHHDCYVFGAFSNVLYRVFYSVFTVFLPLILVAPMDFDSVSESLTFDQNTGRQCVNVMTNVDDLVEGLENLTVVLTSSDNVTFNPEETTIIIEDVGGKTECELRGVVACCCCNC